MLAGLVVVFVLAANSAHATNYQWDVNGSTAGLGGTGAWNTTSLFWDTLGSGTDTGTDVTVAHTFTSSEAATFAGTAGTATLAAGVTVNAITVNTANYIIAGSTLTMAGTTPTITANQNFTISSIIAGTAGLTKAGTGTLILTGTDTYTGTTTISGGTLQIGAAGTAGALSTGAIVDNAALVYNLVGSGTSVTLPATGITGTGTLSATSDTIVLSGNVNTSGNQTYNATATAGSLSTGVNVNAGTVTLTTTTGATITMAGDVGKAGGAGNNLALDTSSGNGTINLNISTARFNDWYALTSFSANAGTGIINVTGSGPASSGWGNAATLTGAVNITGNLASTSPLTIDSGSTTTGTASGILSGNLALTKAGTGTLTLSAKNTYTGATTISGGTLTIGGAGQLGGGNYAGALANSGTLNYNSTAGQTLSGVISGGGTLTQQGAGTLTLAGVNTYTGATTVSGGTLIIASTGSIATNSTATINASGTLRISQPAGVGNSNNLVLNGGTVFAAQDNIGSGGTITVSGGLVTHTFISSGTLIIPAGVTASELIVGGGGAGAANNYAGGGGGGQVKNTTGASLSSGSTTITVGAGGASSGAVGGNSSVGTYSAGQPNSATGGSGGLGGQNLGPTGGNGGASGSGNAGGVATSGAYAGGGGGGNSAVGATGIFHGAGAGGAGTANTAISGLTSYGQVSGGSYYFGGGGGGSTDSPYNGSGGLGGGGAGGWASLTPGTANTGGGGGGGTSGGFSIGGSGLVVIQYPYAVTGPATLVGTIDVQAASTLDAYGSGGVLIVSNTLATSTGAGGLTIASSGNAGGVVQFANAMTYLGATIINASTLKITAGSLTNTAISFVGAGTLAVQPGSSTTINAGTTVAGTAGATLNLGGNTFDMTDGAVSTFNLQQNVSFATAGLTIANGATLKFNLGNASADLLAVTKAASVSGTVNVTIDTTGATSLTPNTYNLITAASGLTGGTWQFTGGGTTKTVTVGGNNYQISLNASGTAISVTVAGPYYTVTYNGNGNTGGAVPVDGSSPYVSGSTVTVLGNTGSLVKTGTSFNNWNTAADGSGTVYSSGNTFTIAANTTLYAQWPATITAPGTFPGAVSTTYGTASSSTSVAVSGASLTANITATAPTGLEVSSDNTTFGATATFTQSGGSASGTLYARLKNNALVSGSPYNSQNVVLSTAFATSVNVATAASGNTVTAKTLNGVTATAASKLYDGTTAATVTGTLQTAEAFGSGSGDGKPYTGDTLTLSASGYTFASSAVGNSITVSGGTFTLGGAANGNYTLTQPGSLSANIDNTPVWNNAAGGSWPTAGNWQDNLIATNTDNTADFSTLTLSANSTVTLDGARTIGNLIFGDVGNTYGWTLNPGSGDPLTLAVSSGAPTITVNGQTSTIGLVLAGSQGLTKAGAGTLTLSGTNTYTGSTTVSNGTLVLAVGGSINNAGTTTVDASSKFVIAATGSSLIHSNNLVLNGGTVGTALTLFGGATDNTGSGGTITVSGGLVTHTFTSSGTLVIPTSVSASELIVGGGGSQGSVNNWTGGGGGGKVSNLTSQLIASGSTAVTVGAGGTHAAGGASSAGGTSSIGANSAVGGQSGGTSHQGGASGSGIAGVANAYGSQSAGGSGDSAAGTSGASSVPGNGGAGSANTAITGLSTILGFNSFGGGGAGNNGVPTGTASDGGGTGEGGSGTANRGGGGAGGNLNSANGYGGSGIVVVQYPYVALGPVTLGGTIDVQAASILDAYGSGGVLIVSNTLATSTGTGGLTVASSSNAGGVVRYANAMTYLGDTTITGGATLQMNYLNALPNGSGMGNVVLNGGTTAGTLDLNNFNTGINGLNGTTGAVLGQVVNNGGGSATLTVGNGNANGTFAGLIADHTSGTGTVALTKTGTGTQTLTGANTYTGATTISAGTLALGSSGSINNTPSISLAAGATFDVSAISAYALSTSTTLSAAGTVSAATITGASGGTVNLGSRPIVLTYDGSHPALTISQGTLQLNSNAFTVNSASPLAPGTYTVVSASSAIASAGTYSVAGTAIGGGTVGTVSVSGNNVILTIQNTTTTALVLSSGGNPSTYGGALTFQATVSPAPADGETITFNDGATAIGTGTTTSGVATLVISSLPASGHSITASYPGDASNVSSTSSILSQNVNSTALTITANSTNKVYDGAAYTGGNGATYAGFVNGQTNTILAGSLTYTGNSQGAIAAGTYTITPSGLSNLAGTNYAINYVNGTLTVSAPTLTITAASTNKFYGQTLALTGFTTTGLVGSDAVSSVILTSGGTAGTATVGSYPMVITNAVGNGLTNYSLSYVNGTLAVNALAASLTGTRAYDGTTNALGSGLTITNLVNSDVVTLSGTGGLASAYVGTNAITSFGALALSGDAGTNYTLAGASGSMTITNTPLTITANNDSKIYDGVPYAVDANGVTYAGFVNGETNTALGGTLTYGGTAAGATTVGSYTITPAGYASTNYLISYFSGTLTISQAVTTVALASSNQTNGFLDSVFFTATNLAGVPDGESVLFTANGVAFSTNTLTGGGATSLAITNLPRGTNVITVAYLGDGNYFGSTNSLNQFVTNHPPVAVDATYYRAKGLSLKIAITNLLTNVTDVDGDTNTLQSVGAGLTNATIMTDNTCVYYLPGTGAGSNDNDVVSYTVSDGFGGTATANILINVYSATGQAQMSIPTNGVVNIKFFGIPNYTYVVQTTTNLAVPWWTLSTNTASTNGSWQFTDPNATNSQQYYRSAQP
jgi:autotransporter-associated beta strand protein